MVETFVLVVAFAGELAFLAWCYRRANEHHALAGRFGPVERDRVIAKRARAGLDDVERALCLDAFACAAEGSPSAAIRRSGRRVYEWRFTDGSAWRVRQAEAVWRPVTAIVVHAQRDSDGVLVHLYEAGRHQHFRVRVAAELTRHGSDAKPTRP